MPDKAGRAVDANPENNIQPNKEERREPILPDRHIAFPLPCRRETCSGTLRLPKHLRLGGFGSDYSVHALVCITDNY
jgi:hypothetical protein